MSADKKKCLYCDKIIDAQAIEALHGDPGLLGSVVPVGHMVASGFAAIASNQSVAATSGSIAIGGSVAGDVIVNKGETPKRPFLAPPLPNHKLIGRDNLLRDLKQRLFLEANLAGSPFAGCPRITSSFCPYFSGEKGDVISRSALVGLPGVGKTALAVELANDRYVRKYFEDGVLWARLGREPDVSAELTRWGVALGIPSEEMAKLKTVGAKVDRVRAAIGTRRMLLVVDDAWQAEAALTFRLGGPNCAHLVTTRFFEIAERFAGNGTLVVPELEHADGLVLLKELASDVVDGEPKAAEKLVQAVGGLPLALILMGNYLKIEGRNNESDRIRKALDNLKQAEERVKLEEPQVAAERHPSLPEGAPVSLDAIIAVSYEALDEASRRTLRALSVFPPKPNTFSKEAAVQVSNEPVEALYTLYDYGLLESRPSNRYTLHQTIADYARLRLLHPKKSVMTRGISWIRKQLNFRNFLKNADENDVYHRRAADYFAAFAQQHCGTEGYPLLDLDWRNISHSMEWAYEHKQWQALLDGVQGLTDHNLGVVGFMDARGYWSNARELLPKGLEGANTLGYRQVEASILAKMGAFAVRQAEFEVAEGHLEESSKILEQLPSSEDVVLQHAHVCEFRFLLEMRRDPQAALSWAEKGLALLKGLSDDTAIYEKGYLHLISSARLYDLGQHNKAIQAAEEGLALLPSSPTSARIIGLTTLSSVYSLLGDVEKSIEYQKEGIKIAQDLGDRRREAVLWTSMGLDEGNRGNVSEAVENFKNSLEVYQKMGHINGEKNAHTNLGVFYIVLGEDKPAERHLKEAIRLSESYQLIKGEAYGRTYLANLLIYQNKVIEAESALARAYEICVERQLASLLPVVLYWQAEAARKKGQHDQALTLIAESLQMAEKGGYLLEKGIAWSIKGKILDAMQRFDEAQNAHQTSLEILGKQYPYERAQSQQALAEHFIMRDGILSDRAKSLLEQALAAFEQLDAKREIRKTKALLLEI